MIIIFTFKTSYFFPNINALSDTEEDRAKNELQNKFQE